MGILKKFSIGIRLVAFSIVQDPREAIRKQMKKNLDPGILL
jgi:hypothetical protein